MSVVLVVLRKLTQKWIGVSVILVQWLLLLLLKLMLKLFLIVEHLNHGFRVVLYTIVKLSVVRMILIVNMSWKLLLIEPTRLIVRHLVHVLLNRWVLVDLTDCMRISSQRIHSWWLIVRLMMHWWLLIEQHVNRITSTYTNRRRA